MPGLADTTVTVSAINSVLEYFPASVSHGHSLLDGRFAFKCLEQIKHCSTCVDVEQTATAARTQSTYDGSKCCLNETKRWNAHC